MQLYVREMLRRSSESRRTMSMFYGCMMKEASIDSIVVLSCAQEVQDLDFVIIVAITLCDHVSKID